MSRLLLECEFDPDDTDLVSLRALVETDKFKGDVLVWAQPDDLVEFASALSPYPLTKENPPECEWGHYIENGHSVIGAKITILPANLIGDLDVIAYLVDQHDERNQCRSVFRTHYPDVDRFRIEIEQMMKGERSQASLTGH